MVVMEKLSEEWVDLGWLGEACWNICGVETENRNVLVLVPEHERRNLPRWHPGKAFSVPGKY